MNKNKILGFLILFALLVTCIGVSFASDDFDDSYIDNDILDENNIDDIDMDDTYIDDDSDFDEENENWDDYDEEDWDDMDDTYIDDDSDFDEEDEDWDDYDEEDWFEDSQSDIAHEEKGTFTENGTVYYFHYITYKSGKAIGCCYSASNDVSNEDDRKIAHKNTSSASDNNYNNDESYSNANALTYNNINHDSIVKSIDISAVAENSLSEDSGNTIVKNKLTNETNEAKNNDNYGIFTLLALLIISLIVFI